MGLQQQEQKAIPVPSNQSNLSIHFQMGRQFGKLEAIMEEVSQLKTYQSSKKQEEKFKKVSISNGTCSSK